MGVGSYFEFVVLAFGWIVYDGVWAVLNDTGIVYLPFLGIVVKNVIESKKAGDDEGSAAVQSLKKIEVDTVVAVVVVFLAAVPSFPLDMAQMRYVRPSLECGAGGGGIVTAGDAAAPYGPIRAQLSGASAEIPLWWAAMHQLGKALAAGAMAAIPCSSDVRGLHMRVGREAIDDAVALESMRRFAGECHRRAVALWAEGHGLAGSADCAAVGELPARGGCVPRLPGGMSTARPQLSRADEIKASFDYAGSAWLAETIYPALQSTVDMSGLGWARALPRDAARPSGAYPMCAAWWTGLRVGLLGGLDADLVADATDPAVGADGRALGWYARPENMWPHGSAEDAVLAAVLDGRFRAATDSGDGFGRTVSYNAALRERGRAHDIRVQREIDAGNYGTAAKKLLQGGGALVGGAAADLVAVAGAGIKSLAWAAEGVAIRETVTMLQGLAQLIFVVGLPFMLVFSGYSAAKLVLFTVVHFGLNFLSALWGVAFWLDNNLAGMLDMRHQGPIQSVMIHNVTKTVFIVMPSVWVAMMGWAGWHAQGLVEAGTSQLAGASRAAAETGVGVAAAAARAVPGPVGKAASVVGRSRGV